MAIVPALAFLPAVMFLIDFPQVTHGRAMLCGDGAPPRRHNTLPLAPGVLGERDLGFLRLTI